MTIIAFNRYWVMRWHWVFICLLATAFLMSLSFWQLSRATEKKQTLARIAQWQAAGALTSQQLLALGDQDLDGVHVKFAARWVSPIIWLLDNQLVDGRIGYDVVIPVEEIPADLSNSASTNLVPPVLINLGWVAAVGGREQLPDVAIPAQLMVDGVFRTAPQGLLLGTNIEDNGHWPMRIQQLDALSLAPYLPSLTTLGVIFQQQQSPYRVHYQPVILPPERHRAYALQWALLAVAVIVIALSASAKKELIHDQS